MKESEVMQLLQHYRHDLLNQLQLVQGYLSMGKKNRVEEKLQELFSSLNEERKLTSLQTPKFALWLLQFNHIYKNFRITYKIDLDNHSLASQDEFLVNKCKKVMDLCEEISNPYVLYNVELVINTNKLASIYELSITIHDLENFDHIVANQAENNIDKMTKIENGIVFQFKIPKG